MKSILFAFLGLALLFTGCSKEYSLEDKADNSFFVRFQLDRENKEYLENVLALRSNDNGMETVTVQGLVDLSANPAGLALLISQTDPIVAQTYPENFGSDSPAMLYRDTDGTEFTNLFMNAPSGLEIVISEINTETIRGTFKGTVSDLNGNTREVTDGSFFAKFQ